MKNSTKIRFGLAVVVVTLLTIGLFMGIQGMASLWPLVWLLVIDTFELTKPIPRNERWKTIVGVVGFLAGMFTLIFLHLAYPNATIWKGPNPNTITLRLVAVSLWILSLWAIYRRWLAERGKALA